ncbi:MAG: helix-turn-helix transcriptional regulator [Candidatus Hydrothermarchaeota archaeon]
MSSKNVLIFVMLLLIVYPCFSIHIEGKAFHWSTFQPLPSTIVRVYRNSTLTDQVICDQNGYYKLDLPPGRYIFVAFTVNQSGGISYFTQMNITLLKEKEITRLDLPMFPKLEDIFPEIEKLPYEIENLPDIEEYSTIDFEMNNKFDFIYFIIFLSMIILLLAFLYFRREKYVREDLTDDEIRIINILKTHGKEMFQTDLTKEIGYSPAKVSLILSALEEKGIIEKRAKGRANIISLRPK